VEDGAALLLAISPELGKSVDWLVTGENGKINVYRWVSASHSGTFRLMLRDY
jgi:hypothetical protein